MAEKKIIPYTSGAEKLENDKKACLAMLKPEFLPMIGKAYEMLFDALIQKCKLDETFDTMVNQQHKTWQRAMLYAEQKVKDSLNPTEEQKKLARAGQPIMAPVDMDTMVSYVEAYYRLDDKAEWEKKEKNEKSFKERLEKAKAQSEAKPKKKSDKKKSEKADKQNNSPAQMSIMDFFSTSPNDDKDADNSVEVTKTENVPAKIQKADKAEKEEKEEKPALEQMDIMSFLGMRE